MPINRSKQPIPEPTNSFDLPIFSSIVDESLYLFRANIFFRNFEVKGPADRTLLYALLFIQECLGQVTGSKSRKEVEKNLIVLASGTNFPIPGDKSFNLSSIFPTPPTKSESEALRQYLTELRVELVYGLLDRLYTVEGNSNEPNKWWMSLSKRKFMNKSL